MKFHQLCTRHQTGLLVQEEKNIWSKYMCKLGNFSLQFNFVNSTQQSAAMATQKTRSAQPRDTGISARTQIFRVLLSCARVKRSRVQLKWTGWLIKVSETFYVRVYRRYFCLVILLGNQRVVVSHKMSLKLTKINLWVLNEIKAFFSWTESLWKFEENFNKCLSQNPT